MDKNSKKEGENHKTTELILNDKRQRILYFKRLRVQKNSKDYEKRVKIIKILLKRLK